MSTCVILSLLNRAFISFSEMTRPGVSFNFSFRFNLYAVLMRSIRIARDSSSRRCECLGELSSTTSSWKTEAGSRGKLFITVALALGVITVGLAGNIGVFLLRAVLLRGCSDNFKCIFPGIIASIARRGASEGFGIAEFSVSFCRSALR
jgi:hypothetical protein